MQRSECDLEYNSTTCTQCINYHCKECELLRRKLTFLNVQLLHVILILEYHDYRGVNHDDNCDSIFYYHPTLIYMI